MPSARSRKRAKRNLRDGMVVFEPKSSRVIFLNPFLILMQIPKDTNTSLPVWEAMRAQQVDIAWTINPYSIAIHLTPVTSKQGQSASSSTAQSLVPSSSSLEPQILVQSISQEHDTSEDFNIRLTISESSTPPLPGPPGQPQQVPLTPSPATSLTVSLPVILSQLQPAHQPHTSTKKPFLPAIQASATPTELQAPSIGPVPSSFHTRNTSNTRICDKFLLNSCQAGSNCKMHHTPYPFHWQLWSVITLQWIDVPPDSQVLLEKNYCNVSQGFIEINDGQDRFTLMFDTMDLDITSKYDGVRRLTNSSSLVKNPYFPSKWKVCWWNTHDWEEYEKDLSATLLKKMSKKETEHSFHIDSHEYKVDFTTMVQTNVATGFDRDVRCRPLYRSPDTMQPHLRTGIQTEPVSDPPGASFSVDPLEEFSSWYPPVWCLDSVQDYSLVDVPAGTQAFRSVQKFFNEGLPETSVDIVSIQQVQNRLHWDKYQRHKVHMQKQHSKSKEPLERHLFHGTTKEAVGDICHNNFDPRMAGVNGSSNGFGSYFAPSSLFSNTFATMGLDEVRHMFLAKLLVGNVIPGKSKYRRPPPLQSKKGQFCLYDTCVDDMDTPSMYIVFDSCRCYPYYLIKYKDLPHEIKM